MRPHGVGGIPHERPVARPLAGCLCIRRSVPGWMIYLPRLAILPPVLGRFATSIIVLIAATAVAVPSGALGDLPPGGTFADDDGSVHEGAIEALTAAGISSGCGPERFCPARLLTRSEMAAFLARALALPPSSNDWFADDNDHLFETEINSISAASVTQGCNPGMFCPDETMSRGQMASFLARAFAIPATDIDAFSDDTGSVHEASINAIAAAGITTGCDDGRYCPLERVRRDQMASLLVRAMGLELIVPPPRAPQLCRTADPASPTGTFTTAAGGHPPSPGGGTIWRYAVQVEVGLGIDPNCVAASVAMVLADEARGWGSSGARSFERVDPAAADFIVTLAFPSTTDQLCHPIRTGGIYSCWSGRQAVLNSWRWEAGAAAYAEVDQYRIYLIGHEVGHALGFGHRSCPGAGQPSPVMMQQTKSVGSCTPDPWPESYEL